MDNPSAAELTLHVTNVQTARDLLPIWTDWGVQDSEVWIHSLGVTFWTALGQKLGFVAVSEVPSPHKSAYADIGDKIRSDSVWFNREDQKPFLIVEFERYSGIEDEEKLAGKIRNLLLAKHRWSEAAASLVLAYWTKGLVALPRHQGLKKIIGNGFETSLKERIGGVKGELLFYHFLMHESRDGSLRLSQIFERGGS